MNDRYEVSKIRNEERRVFCFNQVRVYTTDE